MNEIPVNLAWPEWKLTERIGSGSYGAVYKAERRDEFVVSSSAIKIVSVPASIAEVESLRAEGLDDEKIRAFFWRIVLDCVGEVQLMQSVKGTTNIVNIEDYKVVPRPAGEFGWDIYIRMELLTPFEDYVLEHPMTEAQVLKLGMDICSALEVCAKTNIIHRDVKPENICVNEYGDFKLGDFGIARKLENSTGGMSRKGTVNYMAPEVAKGAQYDARVDTYSLGLVLYRLLNRNRFPFVESEEDQLNPIAREEALNRRLGGEMLRPPCDASPRASGIIMHACAYDPDARFATPTEMKEALEFALEGAPNVAAPVEERIPTDDDRTVRVRSGTPQNQPLYGPSGESPAPFGAPQPQPVLPYPNGPTQTPPPKKKNSSNSVLIIVLVILAVTVTAVAVIMLLRPDLFGLSGKDGDVKNETAETAASDLATPDETASPDSQTDAAIVTEVPVVTELPVTEAPQTEAPVVSTEPPDTEPPDTTDLAIEAALAEAEALAGKGDYPGAIQRIREARAEFGERSVFTDAEKKYISSYKSETIKKADALAADGNTRSAEKLILDALDVVGEDAELRAKLEEYRSTFVVPETTDETAKQYVSIGRTYYINANGGLNLRQGPGTTNPVVTLMKDLSPVVCLGFRDGWANVRYNGEVGWCSMDYLISSPDGHTPGVVEVTEDQLTQAARAANAIIASYKGKRTAGARTDMDAAGAAAFYAEAERVLLETTLEFDSAIGNTVDVVRITQATENRWASSVFVTVDSSRFSSVEEVCDYYFSLFGDAIAERLLQNHIFMLNGRLCAAGSVTGLAGTYVSHSVRVSASGGGYSVAVDVTRLASDGTRKTETFTNFCEPEDGAWVFTSIKYYQS